MQVLFLISLLTLVLLTESLRVPTFKSIRKMNNLKMSDSADPLAAIRAKMASDPSYDPLKDPDAIRQIENIIPTPLRDISNAIARLQVAFKDSTTGTEAVDDLDARAKEIPNKRELISSPQSTWFKQSNPDEEIPFSKAKLQELQEKLRKEFPEVPLVE